MTNPPIQHEKSRSEARRGDFRERVSMRRLSSQESEMFLDHLLRLDSNARRLRFGHLVGGEFLQSYARQSLTGNAVVEGLFVNGELRGVAELRFSKDERSRAEAAFSVEADFQGRGLGHQLFDQIVLVARNRGVRHLHIVYLRENTRIMALVKKHAASIQFEGSEVIAELEAEPADLKSLRGEWRQEARAISNAIFERRLANWRRWTAPFFGTQK